LRLVSAFRAHSQLHSCHRDGGWVLVGGIDWFGDVGRHLGWRDLDRTMRLGESSTDSLDFSSHGCSVFLHRLFLCTLIWMHVSH